MSVNKHTHTALIFAVLLPAIVTVTLYTVTRANAQGNETSTTGGQEHNMTNATGGQEHNMTNATGGQEESAVGSCVPLGNREIC
jgi:hypothetical protein